MNRLIGALESDLPLIHAALTRRLPVTLAGVVGFFLLLQWGAYVVALAGSEGYVTQFGPVIGGDFIVFHEAAKAAWTDPAALYGYAELNARLADAFPAYGDDFRLGWQYPPTMYLILAPLAFAPYPVAYGLWLACGLAAFILAAKRMWPAPFALFFLLAGPAIFQAAITGQTGLFTGALLLLAAYAPDKRPIVAGLAAGLLTIKPQLGLLIPIAFAASGAWRAFFVAAATALGLACAAYGFFGPAPWRAFLDAAAHQGGHMGAAVFPLQKLTSVYGAAATVGAPASLAIAAQAATFLGLAAAVAIAYRGRAPAAAKAAVLMTAALLAAPYAFYYELPIAAGALFLLARNASENDFLPGEGLAIGALWLTPIFMPGDAAPAFPIVAAAAIAAFACAARRAQLLPIRLTA
ncbi:MAG: glycosyltransferase family 87 protein [Pseudomonadota bacterium]